MSHNLVAKQGKTFKLNFRVDTNGVPWDLSTYDVTMTIKRSTSDQNTLAQFSTGAGTIVTTSAGHVSVTGSASVMAALPVGRWVYDVEYNSGSETGEWLSGRFIVSAEVSA